MRGMVQVDRSPDTLAASLHRGVKSPSAVACPLHVTSRFALYCRYPAVLISCTYLMLVIHCVWLVMCAFNVLMMSLLLGALGMHGHTSKVDGHRARGSSRALPYREAGSSHRTRGDTGALSGGGPGASDMWRC
jgi:hypothetical protein